MERTWKAYKEFGIPYFEYRGKRYRMHGYASTDTLYLYEECEHGLRLITYVQCGWLNEDFQVLEDKYNTIKYYDLSGLTGADDLFYSFAYDIDVEIATRDLIKKYIPQSEIDKADPFFEHHDP